MTQRSKLYKYMVLEAIALTANKRETIFTNSSLHQFRVVTDRKWIKNTLTGKTYAEIIFSTKMEKTFICCALGTWKLETRQDCKDFAQWLHNEAIGVYLDYVKRGF